MFQHKATLIKTELYEETLKGSRKMESKNKDINIIFQHKFHQVEDTFITYTSHLVHH